MKRVLIALTLVVTVVVTVILNAPAAWIGDWIAERSKLRLVDARGTVWRGSALLGMSDGRATTLVPGRIDWRLELLPEPSVDITHPWLAAPLKLWMRGSALAFGAGSARLPAGVLASAGMPFNTLRPGGTLEARWSQGEFRAGALTGERRSIGAMQHRHFLRWPARTYRILVTGGGTPRRWTCNPARTPPDGGFRQNQRFAGTLPRHCHSRAELAGSLGRAARRARHAFRGQGAAGVRYVKNKRGAQYALHGEGRREGVAAALVTAAALLLPPAHAQQRVTLNFVNTEIEAVARAMSDFTGRIFAVDPRVKGTVTLVVDRPVGAGERSAPWPRRFACRTSRSSMRVA